MKPEKSFGEIWSELTQEQSEYLKGYINRQRIDAINIHEKVSAKQIEKLEADKAELLERKKGYVQILQIVLDNPANNLSKSTIDLIGTLIRDLENTKKHKQ